ncbi:MAG: cell division protein SepF [Candidatus Aenigmatarchaeota archaeon]
MRIFNKSEEKEFVELDVETEEPTNKKLLIEIEKLENFNDSDRLQKKVRDGNVLLVKIKELKNKDMNELKRAIEKIKKTCLAIEGDIAGIGEDWIVVCPSNVKVHRELVEE